MILPLLLLPLVSFGVVAQDPQSQQLQVVGFFTQCPYTLVAPPTRFTPAKYVCTGTSIKFQTDHAKSLTETIARLCEKAIERVTRKPCPPQAVIEDYNKHAAECRYFEGEAKNAYGTWSLACKHAKDDGGRNRSGKRIREERSSANCLGREFIDLDKKAEDSCRSLNEKWKIIQKMEKACVRKRERKEHNYGGAITNLLKKQLAIDEYIKEST
ncbi:hypothetical protein BASA61_004894 [Batrachochytrium salamandrivorans]|nr:hypothetical protein BASA60_005601 [Batrachochytrium salamandrivorans]KAH6577312.1 hypothetical protein BASA62_000950 [Batrachochytrium salamandrivorans]KAH6591578.1 hypothetical protein BASA61_004894 [Batrachochytrium salamandrivorans]